MRIPKWTLMAAIALASMKVTAALPQQPAPAFDVVIRGGTVVDGTGAAGTRADVGITGDRIALVSPEGIEESRGRLVLDATGLVVAPGFIDQHAHIQDIADYPMAESHVRQGITSLVSSPHSGDQVYPLGAYISSLKVAPNIGYFAGHSTIRRKVVGTSPRAATEAELAQMKALVTEYMRDGALGLSTGVAGGVGSRAPMSEIVELARVAAANGGIYVSHIRDEGPHVVEAVEEFLRVVEAAKIPGQISHHTVAGKAQWGWTTKTLGLVDAARARGLDIRLDIYPYTANAVSSEALIPAWLIQGAPEDAAARSRWVKDKIAEDTTRSKAEAEIVHALESEYIGGDLSRGRFLRVSGAPALAGRTLDQAVRDRGLPVSAASAARLMLDLEASGGFWIVMDSIHEDDLRRLMRHPATLFDTEGPLTGVNEGRPMPRSYGSFPRILGKYVRDEKVLTLEEAIRKMTSESAAQIGQTDRGRIRKGAFADITVFDARTIGDRSTFENPDHFSVGIRHVLINGVPVIRGGALTGEKPGRALKGPARAKLQPPNADVQPSGRGGGALEITEGRE